jgi:hypothetical protein
MSLLKGLHKGAPISAPTVERDSVGGGGQVESGIYGAEITMAYLQKSAVKNGKGGALGVFLTFKTDEGKQVKQTIYIQSGVDKGEKATYTNKNGEEEYLPGYLLMNSLTCLTIGKELHEELDEEEKAVKIYNFEAKADVATKVPVLTELIGQKVKIGVVKQTVSKKKLEGGVYVTTGETRDENEIIKFFRYDDNMTTAEIIAEKTEATFYKDWLAKFEGKTLDKTEKPAGGAPTAAGAPAAKPAATKPASSLFKRPAPAAGTTQADE